MNATNPGRRPTIRDVASAAGVSKSLVSLVYANPSSVSSERTRRVLDAAAELGFRPNAVARSLAGNDGNFIGILVADLHNPVFSEIVDAARRELARVGEVSLMTSATLPGDTSQHVLDDRLLALFRDLRPRGILIVGSVPDMAAVASFAASSRIVVASAIADQLPTAHTVRGDDVAGMRLVVDHLVGLGHRDIAHIGGQGGLVAQARAHAYEAAMAAHGLVDFVRVAPADYSESSGHAAAEMLLTSGTAPTAITAVNDLAAVGALAAAGEHDLQISVTGYDDTYLAALRQISLTTVDPGNEAIGTRAAEVLSGNTAPPENELLIPPMLRIRNSTTRIP
ncbi:LacI family DNA-binding transcriptional regulator [Luethyella okanaganae]|uniref:LacI family DNA-binding transcriptional regulator n=1 Tax=Luethyella okanaganae TaxID=69372 RepID=A0ABW1VG03_9MICO